MLGQVLPSEAETEGRVLGSWVLECWTLANHKNVHDDAGKGVGIFFLFFFIFIFIFIFISPPFEIAGAARYIDFVG